MPCNHDTGAAFGLLVIGDELLTGKRQDKHLAHVSAVLNDRGAGLAWCRYVGDSEPRIAEALRQTQEGEVPVLCFGGIGATPDDRTRQAAASAFGRTLVMHGDACKAIEARFGDAAYPNRVRMAQLPEDCLLIPNPVNGIPGFTLYDHHFLPGFPQLAWPMLSWVLETYYPRRSAPQVERALRVEGVMESVLIPVLEQQASRHGNVKLFSLPRMGRINSVEVGFRGEPVAVDVAMTDLEDALRVNGMAFQQAS